MAARHERCKRVVKVEPRHVTCDSRPGVRWQARPAIFLVAAAFVAAAGVWAAGLFYAKVATVRREGLATISEKANQLYLSFTCWSMAPLPKRH